LPQPFLVNIGLQSPLLSLIGHLFDCSGNHAYYSRNQVGQIIEAVVGLSATGIELNIRSARRRRAQIMKDKNSVYARSHSVSDAQLVPNFLRPRTGTYEEVRGLRIARDESFEPK
jgi:hypothetical protein